LPALSKKTLNIKPFGKRRNAGILLAMNASEFSNMLELLSLLRGSRGVCQQDAGVPLFKYFCPTAYI